MLRLIALLPSWRVTVIVISQLILISCADIVGTSRPTDEASVLIQQSMKLQRGMTQNEVHTIVGVPYKKSEYLKYEIFQFTGEFKEYWGMFPIPYVPLLGYQTKAYIPVLFVIYNDDWTVKNFEWDLYRESSSRDRKIAHIELDNYTLLRTRTDLTGLMLLAPTEISEQAILEPILANHCALYVIVPGQPMEDKNQKWVPSDSELFLNDKPLIHPYDFPNNSAWLPDVLETTADNEFVAIDLPEGVYEIELRGSNGAVKGSIKGEFTCVAGKTIFAGIRAEFNDEGMWRWKYRYRIEGEIHISNHWPNETKTRRQVLMHRDKWYGLDYQK